ncbi:MAG TPA: pentapeptide repeat-containing protein [Syntrophobacteraceae bacterium]|nr:pentapeptide repeat-containing protein [Syntrophobacteraceae bacterium]
MQRNSVIIAWFLATILTVHLLPVLGEEIQVKNSWKGKLSDGTVITEDDLQKILASHSMWLKSSSEKGRKADLRGADLRDAILDGANLSAADLSAANLSNAHLSGADLRDANLTGANLRIAKMKSADLSRATATGADLSWAELIGGKLQETRLSGADLSGADLSEADLFKADLTQATLKLAKGQKASFLEAKLEPMDSTEFLFIGAKGLSEIVFSSPRAVVELRKAARDLGFKNEEKALLSALYKYQMKTRPWYERYLAASLLGGRITDYGASPLRSLLFLLMLLIPFTIIYAIALWKPGRNGGIWAVQQPDCVLKSPQLKNPVRRTTERRLAECFQRPEHSSSQKLKRYWLCTVWTAFYFSVLSAFRIGLRELNLGDWLQRLQQREYNLRATGWVRTLSGIQSLISVYLLALWAWTYFGRPFG